MPIQRHRDDFTDAYLDISEYQPEYHYTPADLEKFFISPRPQFPPPPREPEREYIVVDDLDELFEEIIEEAFDEIEIEKVADPLAYKDIVWAFFDATNITYVEKKRKSWFTRCIESLRRCMGRRA